jgi:hypothetical protein
MKRDCAIGVSREKRLGLKATLSEKTREGRFTSDRGKVQWLGEMRISRWEDRYR